MAGPNAGRKGAQWERLKAQVRARREHCCRCGHPIDYTLRWPDRASFSVDHYPYPLSTYPHMAEDPANLRAAHLSCNQSAGDYTTVRVGTTSEEW